MRIGPGIRAGLAAGALAATAALAGCGGGPTDAATASAPVNGAYGAGGPYSAPGAHAGGQQAAASGAGTGGRAALQATGLVDGSTQLNESHGIWWLPELGPGVSATAPETVRPGTASAADAEAGFYDAFYSGRMTTACGYVVPGERRGCAARLARAAPGAGSLRDAAIGYVVAEGDAALVSLTGVVCGSRAAPDSCLGQRSGGWVFEQRETFAVLWARLAAAGGNPLTATPLRLLAGHWYVDLTPPASPGS